LIVAFLVQPPTVVPWAVTPQDTIVITVPADVRKAAAALEYHEDAAIKGLIVDLNRDRVYEFLVQSAPSLCGNGGCRYLLFEGRTHKQLGTFFATWLQVERETANGFPKISTLERLGLNRATYTEYAFDGQAYAVTDTRTVEGSALSALMEKVRAVPIWRQ